MLLVLQNKLTQNIMVSKVKSFSIFLRILLTALFLIMTIRSISKLFSNEVGTRNYVVKSKEGPFPNIALCPYTYAPGVEVVSIGKNMTFDDVMKLPSIFDHVVISVEISKAYSTE